MKFGKAEWTKGPFLHAKFHPHRCNDNSVGSPKLKMLQKFYQILEYKHLTGVYPLHNFHEICRVCTSFQHLLAVKIWMDLLKGLQNYGGSKFRGMGLTRIFSIPSEKTMHRTPKTFWRWKNVLEVLYHHAKFGVARISPTTRAAKNVELFVCLSRFWTLKFVHTILPWRHWITETILMPLDKGRL